MNMKKKLASLMAVVMTAAVVALPHAAYADEALTVIPRSDNLTLGYSDSTPVDMAVVVSAEDYAALSAEEQAMYVKFTTEVLNCCAVYGENNWIASGDYIQKGAKVSICVPIEKYVGRYLYANGVVINMPADVSGYRYYGHDLETNGYFFMPYTIGDSDLNITLSGSRRRPLTNLEEDNFIPVNNIGENVSVYKCSPNGNEFYFYDVNIEVGDYVNRLDSICEYTNLYAVMTPKENLHTASLYVEGNWAFYSETEIGDYSCLIVGGLIGEYPSFNAFVHKYTANPVITAEMYNELDEEDKDLYVRCSKDDDITVWYSMFNNPNFNGGQITYISDGHYVKKNRALYICSPAEKYVGKDILINGEILKCSPTADETSNYDRDTGYGYYTTNFGSLYTIGDEDFTLTLQPRAELTDYEKENFVKITKLDDNIKIYKAYQDIIQKYPYEDTKWLRINEGDYLDRDADSISSDFGYVIRVPADVIGSHELLICGKPANYTINNDNEAQIWGYTVPDDISEFTAVISNNSSMSSISFDPNASGMTLFTFVDETSDGEYLTSSGGNTVVVPNGTELLVSCYKNVMAGFNFTVNGKPISTFINGDYSHFIGRFTADSDKIVIGYEAKTELSDYEKSNFANLYFDPGQIQVNEFFYGGYYGDEDHVHWFSGNLIAKGTEVLIAVTPADYSGKKLMVNGVETEMFINGDGSNYISRYIIPSDTVSVTITLEEKASEPTVPTIPAQPAAPQLPADSTLNNRVGGTSAVSNTSNSSAAAQKVSKNTVVRNIKRSGRASISYDAKGIGITNDVLKAFADNKKSKTLTANFDNLSIVINKSDITDKSKLSGVDIKVSSKKFISNASVKKTKALAESKKVMQLNISGGKLDGIKKVTVKAIADKSLSGRDVTVYEYKDGKLTTVGSAKVDKYGNVSLTTDHLGQFVIAVK